MNIKGSGASAINTFNGGMICDNDPLSSRNNTYYYAENARISQDGSVGSLSNIENFVSNITFSSDPGIFLSYYKTADFTILVSKTDTNINVYKYFLLNSVETCIKVATIIDSVDSNRIKNIDHISINASIESSKIHRVYFADGIHGIFSINIYRDDVDTANWNVEYDASKVEFLSKKYDMPSVSISSNSNGNLTAGKYFYILRYTTDSGSESSDVFISNGINATVDSEYGGTISVDSGSPNITNTAINIKVNSMDDSAYGLNVYRVVYIGSGIGYNAYLIYSNKIKRGTDGAAEQINISDNSDSNILGDYSDILLFNEPIKIASVIENKDNLLFAANIEYRKNPTIDYDVRAFSFDKDKLFRYRNYNDEIGTTPHFVSFDFLENTLTGADDHDFINDDIYSKDRYRDVLYRYKVTETNDPVTDNTCLTYGGIGRNVSYEFIHTYLVAAEEGSLFSNKLSDSTWFKSSEYPGIASSDTDIKSDACLALLNINSCRDDLTIKYGDKDREISAVTIRHQSKLTANSGVDTESVYIDKFGLSTHTGKLDYSNRVIADTFSGFKRNEIFRFAVKFKLNDGSETDPMWISDIRFPSNHIIYNDSLSNNLLDDRRIFSFSSFITPEDTLEGENLLDTMLNDPTNVIENGFDYIAHEDSLGVNNISRAELLVKPLGIKFKFENVPANISSAKILYTPLSLIERTILGQFLVSRIGGYSNGGVEYTDLNKYYESLCDGFAYPHPAPSMKYTYGIGPMLPAEESLPGDAVLTSGFNNKTNLSLGFDAYSGASAPRVCSTLGAYSLMIDHQKSNTNAISMSPYYSDIKNYIFASPDITYSGEIYADVIKSMSSKVVFENLVYSKNTQPWVFESTDSLYYDTVIPTIGSDIKRVDNVSKARGNKNAYLLTEIGADIDNNILYKPWDVNSDLFTPSDSLMYGNLPTFLYTGSFLQKNERLVSNADNSVITLSACGTTTFLILEAVLWNQTPPSMSRRLSDTLVTGSTVSYLFANRFRSGDLGVDSRNVLMPEGKLNDIYTAPEVYEPGDNPFVFFGESVNSSNWKHFEQVWDNRNNIYGDSITNLPISIKTIMSGIGYSFNSVMFASDTKYAFISGYSNEDVSMQWEYSKINEAGRMSSFSSRYLNSTPLTSTTFKYFKSNIPSKSYVQETHADDPYEINRYITFFFQRSNIFSDYRIALSNKSLVAQDSYNPLLDDNLSLSPANEAGIWDIKPIEIDSIFFSGVKKSPTGTFDLSSAEYLAGYNGYINYSKTLSQEMVGMMQSRVNTASPLSSYFSDVYRDFPDTTREALDYEHNPLFVSLNMLKRSKISGKHGAGIVVSLNGSIPMVGHMLNNDYKMNAYLNKMLNNAYTSDSGTDTEKLTKLNRTLLYWNTLDGACAAHTATYLVDIRSKFNYLLNSSSKESKANSKYIESAQTINLGDSTTHEYYVFGGGTYVTLFDYTTTYANRSTPHTSYNGDVDDANNWNSVSNSSQTTRLNALVPIESSINTHVDSGDSNHKIFNTWMLEMAVNGENSPNVGFSASPVVFIQDKDEYIYMDGYSAKKDFNQTQNSYSEDPVFNNNEYSSRIISSEKKVLGEQNDSWSIFKPINYIDLNTSDGSINGLEEFSNRMYALQDNSVSYISINERSLISDGAAGDTQLLLGTGKVFSYSSILSSNFGLSKNTINSIRKGLGGIYFFDNSSKSICRISSTVENLSHSLLNRSMSKTITASNLSFMFKWVNSGEMIFLFDNIDYIGESNKNILFSEKRNSFESFMTEEFSFGFEFNSDIRLINKVYDTTYVLSPTIKSASTMSVNFTVNDLPYQTKIFDSVDINASWTHNNIYNASVDIDSLYSNSIANTGQFETITDRGRFNQNKEASFHSNIPRVYGSLTRMRDKYIRSMYKFTGGEEISLPYIKTNYRYSTI